MTGSMVVLNALQGELERPRQVITGLLGSATTGSLQRQTN
jgi:hypothetical protein